MALEINGLGYIVGKIDNIHEKINGTLPVDRLELIYLINSWGRSNWFLNQVFVNKCEGKECYNLSKLDTSQISNMDYLFAYSEFNGDISNWDISNVTSIKGMFLSTINFNSNINSWNVNKVTNMDYMFSNTKKYNSLISNWNTSNVTSMVGMFSSSEKFNQNLETLDISNVIDMSDMLSNAKKFNSKIVFNLNENTLIDYMLYNTKEFEKRFNNSCELPYKTSELKEWLKENRDVMIALDLNKKEKNNLENYFNNMNSKIDISNINELK